MTISVEVRSRTKQAPLPLRTYPWLGEDGTRVVLFSETGVGTIIRHNDQPSAIGRNYTTWQMSAFKEVPSDAEVVIRQVH